MKYKISPLFVFLIIAIASFSSCKKSKDSNTNPPPSDSTVLANKAKDSALKDSRDFYLWYNQIPESFNEQAYAGPEEIMKAIRNYSNEPGFSQPVDHYSFAIKKAEWDKISTGQATDFGLNVFL